MLFYNIFNYEVYYYEIYSIYGLFGVNIDCFIVILNVYFFFIVVFFDSFN